MVETWQTPPPYSFFKLFPRITSSFTNPSSSSTDSRISLKENLWDLGIMCPLNFLEAARMFVFLVSADPVKLDFPIATISLMPFFSSLGSIITLENIFFAGTRMFVLPVFIAVFNNVISFCSSTSNPSFGLPSNMISPLRFVRTSTVLCLTWLTASADSKNSFNNLGDICVSCFAFMFQRSFFVGSFLFKFIGISLSLIFKK